MNDEEHAFSKAQRAWSQKAFIELLRKCELGIDGYETEEKEIKKYPRRKLGVTIK